MNAWSVFAVTAAILSQVLVIQSWKTTRWATLLNFLVVLCAIPAFAAYQFNKTAAIESKTIMARVAGESNDIVTLANIDHLPPVVQKWLLHSGVVGTAKSSTVRLQQTGQLRTSPLGKWMPFYASEYFTTSEPSFIWISKVEVLPYIFLSGRDKFENGHGEMLVKLMSLFPVAKAAGDSKTDTASLQRYLAEMIWFPSAAIATNIQWQQLNAFSAKATLHCNNISASGIFTFTESGDIAGFVTDRYYNDGKKTVRAKWMVQCSSWKIYNGLRIPNKHIITWQLASGNFTWCTLELINLEYNKPEIYRSTKI